MICEHEIHLTFTCCHRSYKEDSRSRYINHIKNLRFPLVSTFLWQFGETENHQQNYVRCADVLSATYLSSQTPSPADFTCSFSIIMCWIEIRVFTKVYTRNGRMFGESTRISLSDWTPQRHVNFSALAFYWVLHYAYNEVHFELSWKFWKTRWKGTVLLIAPTPAPRQPRQSSCFLVKDRHYTFES